MVNCPECGTPASDEDLFCGECGAILAAPQPEALVPAEPTASPPADTYTPASSAATVPNTRARVAFILGIVSVGSVLINCLPFFGLIACFGPLLGLIAIALGTIAKRDIRARGGREVDWRRAHQGVILGIAGTVLYVVVIALGLVLGLGMSFLGEL